MWQKRPARTSSFLRSRGTTVWYKSVVVVVVMTLGVVLSGCGRGPGSPGGTPGDDPREPAAEKAAVDSVKKHGGHVKQEGGRVVEITLFQNSVTDETLKDLAALTRTRKLRITQARITGA